MSSGFLGGGIGPTAIKRRSGLTAPVPMAESELMNAANSTFDSGTGTWIAYGTNTLTNASGRLRVNWVDNANGAFSGYLRTVDGNVTSTPVVGNWYRIAVDVGVSAGSLIAQFWDGSGLLFFPSVSGASMTSVALNFVCRAAGLYIKTPLSSGYAEVDNVSLQPLILSSLLSTRAYAAANCDLSANITRTAGTQAGFVARLDSASSPANFIIAYLDGASKVRVDKCVAGTYTNVISGAITYGAGKTLRLVCSGNNVSAFYNGAQVGSTVTVSDAGIVSNTRHGLFSTYASNAFANYVAA